MNSLSNFNEQNKLVLCQLMIVLTICYTDSYASKIQSAIQDEFYTAEASLPDRNAKFKGELLLPERSNKLEGILVIVNWGLGSELFENNDIRRAMDDLNCGMLLLSMEFIEPIQNIPVEKQLVRNASAGGAEGLTELMKLLSIKSGRNDLVDLPFAIWGSSAAGSFGISYATLYPERTIAFIRYNAHLRGLPIEIKKINKVPGLIIAGGKDDIAGSDEAKSFWNQGKEAGAPWTLAIQTESPHYSPDELIKANQLLIPWLTSVISTKTISSIDLLNEIKASSVDLIINPKE